MKSVTSEANGPVLTPEVFDRMKARAREPKEDDPDFYERLRRFMGLPPHKTQEREFQE